jgi:hypothetical protein
VLSIRQRIGQIHYSALMEGARGIPMGGFGGTGTNPGTHFRLEVRASPFGDTFTFVCASRMTGALV